ncbi:hypothetical protein ACWD4X_31125 [Streptomyces termitum]
MKAIIEELAEKAERQLSDQVWIPDPADRAIAEKAATGLYALVGAPEVQRALSDVDRLARLREALAAVAIALAHVHGRLAWFLGAAATALTPILNWRALPLEGGPTFGAVEPTAQEYEDAEEAVRRLQATLAAVVVA